MSILNQSKVEDASQVFESEYATAMLSVPQFWKTMASLISISGGSVVITWGQMLGAMKRWIGHREWDNLSAQSVNVVPADFHLDIEVPKKVIDDDTSAVFRDNFVQMGLAAGRVYNDLVGDLLVNGFTANGYDNVPFFSNSHTDNGAGVQDNLMTAVLSADALDDADEQLAAIKAPNGDLLDLKATHLFHGPLTRAVARQLCEADYVTSGVTNMWKGRLTRVEVPRITTVRWAVADLSKGLMPFGVVERQAPEYQQSIDPTSENVKNKKVYQYWTDARLEGYYKWWQLMVGSTAGV